MRLLAALVLLVPVLGALAVGLIAAGCAERPESPDVPTETAVVTPAPPTPNATPAPTTGALMSEGFELVLVIDPPGAGFIAAVPPFGPHAPGTVVTVAVIRPRIPPYVFNRWTGDAEGTERAAQVVMDGPKRVVARFINPYITPTPSAEE